MAGKATKIAAGVVGVVILVNIMLALVYIASISEPARRRHYKRRYRHSDLGHNHLDSTR